MQVDEYCLVYGIVSLIGLQRAMAWFLNNCMIGMYVGKMSVF